MYNIPVNSLRKTIFVRLLGMFFILILPIIILGIYLYNWSYNNASHEIARNSINQLTTYLEDLNREIEWLEIQQYDILQESKLKEIAFTWDTMDNIERKSSVHDILHRLTSIKNTNTYIKDIFIHIPSIDKTISAVNAVQEFKYSHYVELLNSMQSNRRRIMLHEDTLSVRASAISNDINGVHDLVVQIELDKQKMNNALESMNLYPDSATFLISDKLDLLLASGDEIKSIEQKYFNGKSELIDRINLAQTDDSQYQINQVFSDELGLYVVSYIPKETVRKPLTKFSKWAWMFALTSIIAVFIYSYATFKLVHGPLLLLVKGFKRMEEGNLDNPIMHNKEDEFGFLYERYNEMLFKLKKLIDQDYKQKLMMQKAELKQLQSQINPHFLYNSFFILNSLAKTEDIDRMELFTKMLGEYFRFITRNGENKVTLKEEIKHARMYSEIQSLRFSRRILVEFNDLPIEMEEIKVPKLILQPIIENAYEHSLEKKAEEGLLRITFERDNDDIYIIIEDNGNRISDEEINELGHRVENKDEHQELTGIMNIHKRIVLTYGEGSGLIFSRSDLQGLKVIIRMKLKGADSDV
ncbi:two-component sensor histidine kinase [Gracilibacillus oryzae]|uniref:Two-component sensor histidine kinase n=1 Tax=Gracilibacillus oryzae TaxID=1672701 RepID=A0A7C8GSM3_9BACI|nr:histidine kinase [Gracilibacillus oryzae]KAB8131008.1 two-component sensor histidine kinase [Gracilibacillus oryzae]